MKNSAVLFEHERTLIEPDQLYDKSRYNHTVSDTNITYTQLPSGLYVQTFNGSSSEVVLPQALSQRITGKSGVTVMAWVNQDNIDANIQQIFYVCNSANAARVELGTSATNGYVIIAGRSAAEGWQGYTSTLAVTPLKWDFVWGLVDLPAQTVTAGLNNSYLQSTGKAFANNTFQDDTHAISNRIGSAVASRWYDGSLALLRVFGYVMSFTQIRKIYDAERGLFGV